MRVHVLVALTGLSIAGAVPLGEDGRSISEWLWPLAVDTYPEVQPAASAPEGSAVEPTVYQLKEEGRRRSDTPRRQKRIDKDVQVAINVSKGKGGGGGGGGHNTPVKPIAGAPIYGAGGLGHGLGSLGSSPGTVAVVVDEADKSWGWGWIKGIMGSSWGPSWGWGSGSGIGSGIGGGVPGAIVVPNKGVLGSGGSGYGGSVGGHGGHGSGHGGGHGGGYGGDHHGDSDILSVSYGLAPADHYDTHGPGMFNPFSGWWYPSSSAVSGPSHGHDHDHHSPTISEVMVIRYPEFIKTIGKGISKMTNVMKDFGKGVSDTFMKGITDTSAGIGSGVAAIIPLEEVGDPQHAVGGQNYKPGSHGHGIGFNPSAIFPGKGSGAGLGHGGGSHGHGGASVVYVDKHTSPIQNSYVKGSLFSNSGSWFGAGSTIGGGSLPSHGSSSGYLPGMGSALGSLFGSGSGSGHGGPGHGHGGHGPDSTSTVYVDKGKGGLQSSGGSHHHHG